MGKGLSITGLVLGIVALVVGCFGWFKWASFIALPLAIVGIVLSVVGGRKLKASGKKAGIATAGLVLSIIATVLSGIMFCCAICALACVSAAAAL